MSPVGGFTGHDVLWGAPVFVSEEYDGDYIGSKSYYEKLRGSSAGADHEPSSAVGRSMGSSIDNVSLVFGGFAPVALSDPKVGAVDIQKSQELIARFKQARIRAAELEVSRASESREFVDEAGNVWNYVVMDSSSIRIDGCAPAVPEVAIPDYIEGLPVQILSSDACSASAIVEQIVCHDLITLIKPYAFRGNKHLKKLVLPSGVASFDFTWIHCCNELEELHLPDALEKLNSTIFDGAPLKRLYIGSGTSEIVPGAFTHSVLEEVHVSEANPYMVSDGNGIYTRTGDWFVALATPVDSYVIAEGTKVIAKKAFSTFSAVKTITVPGSVMGLGEFAFARTSIREFRAPETLKLIGEKAFYRCKQLKQVALNSGLEEIGTEAFTGTAIEELRIPRSIRALGKNPAAETQLTYAGPSATFSIEEGSEYLFLDHQGCLYANREDGIHLCRMMDPKAKEVSVMAGTRFVDDRAFSKHKGLESIALPKGVAAIGKGAFKDCFNLKTVAVPDSLERLEAEAFLDSGLTSFAIPASLRFMGEHALVTHGAHHGTVAPSLRSLQVPDDHPVFYVKNSMLLERRPHGGIRCVLCLADQEIVRVPEEVTAVSAYALNGLKGVRELYLHDGIRTVGVCGLGVDSALELLHVCMTEPLQGHEEFDFRFPQTARGKQQVCLVLGMLDRIDIAKIYRHYDTAVSMAMSFNGKDSTGMTKYEQAVRILERLADPVFMEPSNRQLMKTILESELVNVSAEMARHDDRKSFEQLFDLGFLTEDNIDLVIDRVAMVQDASMTGYLLEAKRSRFAVNAFDFDL